MKKKYIFLCLSLVLSVILGLSISFAMMTLQESIAYFDNAKQTEIAMNEYNQSGITDYNIISAKLYNFDNKKEQQVVNNADNDLKKNPNYIGMLRKQSDNLNITLVPKNTETKTKKTYKSDNASSIVGSDSYFFTSSPLVLEDTYKNMDIYNEFDKQIMCKNYTVDEQIPIYVSSTVKETYGLDKYVDAVISVKDEKNKNKIITLNCKIIGVEENPSFSMNISSSSICWEIAIPFITNSDGSYLVPEDSLSKAFIFKNYSDNYKQIESDISKYAFITGNFSEDIELFRTYSAQNSEYSRYTVELILSVGILFFALILTTVCFNIIYGKLLNDEETKKSSIAVCAIINILIFAVLPILNYRMEFSGDFFDGFTVPSMTVGNQFVWLGCIIFVLLAGILTSTVIYIKKLFQKRGVQTD